MVGRVAQLSGLGFAQAGQVDVERDLKVHAVLRAAAVQADRRGHIGVVGHALRGQKPKRGKETGGIARRKELLRVRAASARAAKLEGRGQLDAQGAVRAGRKAVPAAKGGGLRAIDKGHNLSPGRLPRARNLPDKR